MLSNTSERCIRVPLDIRLWIGSLWTAAFMILLIATFVWNDEMAVYAWSVFIALAAACWTMVRFLRHNRQVILEVMSWEHRQQGMPALDDAPLTLIRD